MTIGGNDATFLVSPAGGKQTESTEPAPFDNGALDLLRYARPAQRSPEASNSLDRPLLDEPPPADWDAEELALREPL